jgi:hypothetical protein
MMKESARIKKGLFKNLIVADRTFFLGNSMRITLSPLSVCRSPFENMMEKLTGRSSNSPEII